MALVSVRHKDKEQEQDSPVAAGPDQTRALQPLDLIVVFPLALALGVQGELETAIALSDDFPDGFGSEAGLLLPDVLLRRPNRR